MRAVATAATLVLTLIIGVRACGQKPRGVASRPESRQATRRFEPRVTGTPELLVRLERKPCYGTCPVYTLTVTDDGVVAYFGKKYVAIRGAGASWLDSDRFDRLVRAIIELRFEELETRYVHEDWTDDSSATLEIHLNGGSKVIEHYHGDVYCPQGLTRFENLVDQITGSEVWLLTPTERRDLRRWRREQEQASTRPDTRPRFSDLNDAEFAATSEIYAIGVTATVGHDGRNVSLRLDAGKSATVGTKLIVIHDRAYRARVRVTAVERGIPCAVVEHLEPGVSIAPGDLVWDRTP